MKKKSKKTKKTVSEKIIRRCKACGLTTLDRTCLVCGERTKKMPKLEQQVIVRYPRKRSKLMLEYKDQIEIIESRCVDFLCPGKVTGVKVGPLVVEYEFSPAKMTRLKKLRDIHEDLAMTLEADTVMINRVPGRGAVCITVPKKDRETIVFADSLKSFVKVHKDYILPINLGISANGEPYIIDLTKMPHLLVAGSTGAGKSNLLNCILTSLLYCRSVQQLQLVLIDPKCVELTAYNDIPHVKEDVVSNVYNALALLETMVQEMRKRMSFLLYQKVKSLKELNEKCDRENRPDDKLPYIVIVIDEMADLVLQEKKAFTKLMAEISSMSRAAGIHIIAATQRPSVDVLAGKIKVNFPARVAFRVPSAPDSKTVLNEKGAEKLLAQGDMLFINPNATGLQHLHAPLILEEDIRNMKNLSLQYGHFNRSPVDGKPPKAMTDRPEMGYCQTCDKNVGRYDKEHLSHNVEFKQSDKK